ncbi:MAG: serine/threonine-protein phosphatase [Clostridia bacterium]|nr:serine/threonine-protein phosphatase [Clostridia bacterium]
MKKLSADVCSVTHPGRVRKENEDNYSLNGKTTANGGLNKGSAYVQKMSEPFHLAVCDGMGGESFGELASDIAVNTISKYAQNVYDSGEDYSFTISSCLEKANNSICDEITTRGVRIGTTLAAVYAVKGKLICVGLGDTRIYRYSAGILEQISFDHTHAQGIIDSGVVSQNDIKSIPDAKRLTKHLGVFPEEASLSPNISVIDDIEQDSVILLCSDGLTDMLSDDDISEIISNGESAQDVTGKLVRKALEKGGKDNITVITAFMSAEDTAIFVPIAEAMVGNKDPDYEEEYKDSYGTDTDDSGNENASPYANADSQADKKPFDKIKMIKIGSIALIALAILTVGGLIIKAAVNRNSESQTTTTTSLDDYYSQYVYTVESTTEHTTWFTQAPTTEEPTSSTTTLPTTTVPRHTEPPTRKYNPTTRSSTTRSTTTKVATPDDAD